MDRRWQMVLDCLDVDEAPFAQGTLQAFRERMVEHEMDRILLERTVALVRDGVATTAEGKQLSKAVRVAIDSRPLVGAGRVEDTINLDVVGDRPQLSQRASRSEAHRAGPSSPSRQAVSDEEC